MSFWVSLFIGLAVSSAHALSVVEKLNGPVTDLISTRFTYHQMSFSGDRSKKVSYVVVHGKTPQSTPLVIVPGRGSHAFFWAETIFDFRNMGYEGEIYVWDPPGQGLSDRLLTSQPLSNHINDFYDYVNSLEEFLETVKTASSGRPPKVLAHSMSAAIAILAAEEHPELFQRLLALAPMLEIHLGGRLKDIVLSDLVGILGNIPRLRELSVGASTSREILPNSADSSRNDRIRFCWKMEDLFQVKMPGVTIGWVAQAVRGGRDAVSRAAKISIPLKIFVAENDDIVEVGGVTKFMHLCPICESESISGGHHAMVEDVDSIRGPLVNKIFDWLELKPTQSNATGLN
jgi:alpha-beta hydrolase superfamily lysophospholipase